MNWDKHRDMYMAKKITLEYSKSHVDRAGTSLIAKNSVDKDESKIVLDNWRACHTTALNSFQISLRKRLAKIDKKAIVSQRLKRTPSILSKLERENSMRLSRMQDIGGIRAVVHDMKVLRKLVDNYKHPARPSRAFSLKPQGKDYINFPKESGYRSVHLLFKYIDGRWIELQVRTYIQHAWATAIETMGTYLSHALKSGEGPKEWLDFFSLASSAFAIMEKTPRVPKHDSIEVEKLYAMLIEKEIELDVIKKLTGFKVATRHIDNDKRAGDYHLITLNMTTRRASISSFKQNEVEQANKEYSAKEEQISNGEDLQVVLVTSESLRSLKKAYPSYFLDAELFIKQIEKIKKEQLKITPKYKARLFT